MENYPEKIIKLNSAPHLNLPNYFKNYIHSPDNYMSNNIHDSFDSEAGVDKLSESEGDDNINSDLEERVEVWLQSKGIVFTNPLDYFKEKNDQRKIETIKNFGKIERSGSFSSFSSFDQKKGNVSPKKTNLKAEKKKESCISLIRDSFFKRFKTVSLDDEDDSPDSKLESQSLKVGKLLN